MSNGEMHEFDREGRSGSWAVGDERGGRYEQADASRDGGDA